MTDYSAKRKKIQDEAENAWLSAQAVLSDEDATNDEVIDALRTFGDELDNIIANYDD